MPSAQFTPRVVRENRRHEGDRDIRNAHHGWFYSWKLDGQLPYRGLLAFDFLTLAEAHPQVRFITNKSEPVQWWDGLEWQTYYPRYTVVLRTGSRGISRTVDIEVLPKADLDRQKLKFARITREFREQGRLLLTLTEKQLRVQPRLTNAKLILAQAGPDIAANEDQSVIRQIAHGSKHFTLNQVVEFAVLPYARAYAAVLNMVAAGELHFSLGRLFDGDTVVARRAPR